MIKNSVVIECDAKELEYKIRVGEMTRDLMEVLALILKKNVKEGSQDEDAASKVMGFILDYMDTKILEDREVKQRLIDERVCDFKEIEKEINDIKVSELGLN